MFKQREFALILLNFVYYIFLHSFTVKRVAQAEHIDVSNYKQSLCYNWQNATEANVGNCTFSTFENKTTLRCFGGTRNLKFKKEEQLNLTDQLVFCGWPHREFNPIMELKYFQQIQTLTMEYGDFSEITFDFPELNFLQLINISWSNLSHINARTFKKLHSLKVIDLRLNQLKQLDSSFLLPQHFEKMYLASNPWNCTRNFKWLLHSEKGAFVADRDKIICADRKYKDRNMMIVLNYKMTLKQQCQSHPDLNNCSCMMHHIIPKTHQPLYTVNCSNLKFQQFPSFLPENTSTLYLNDNLIKDISPLRYNPNYRYVVDVYLSNNQVESIDELEGSYWLEHFRLLNLQNNKLRKLPVYVIMNALEINENANLMLLGGNPWYCSCIFSMRFRDMLIKYNDLIRDTWNISCLYPLGEHNQRRKLLAISRHDVCDPLEEPAIYTLDLVNAILASLIIFILGKLAYDYYYYKYYGRVPCIVMKLP